ncbi:MAG TPA: SET domain-containing protein [Candidatus Paceibacterota bacterium]
METIDAPIRIAKSRPGLGLGLFATAPLARGERIVEYTGTRVSASEADHLKTRYVLEVDDRWAIDGSPRHNIARYINHSCAPNCEGDLSDGRVFIRAMQNIAAGEELTLDYGDEYFEEFIRPIGCKCGKCSAVIG